jgi:hypothetical protein
MKLPHCTIHSLFIRSFHFLTIVIAILIPGILPLVASANAQLVCTPTRIGFGQVVAGQSETLPATVTNTGSTSVTISNITVDNAEFQLSPVSLPLTLPAGQSVTLNVTFSASTLGWTAGTIKIYSDAPNDVLPLEVAGKAVNMEAVTASPAVVSFGQVAIGSVATVPVVLTNSLSWKITLSAMQTTGSGFSITGPAMPLTLAAGQSVTVNVTFSPQSAGTAGGALFVFGPQLSIPLSGSASMGGQLTANPASLAFGQVQVGNNVTVLDSITNTGGANVTISQVNVSGTGFSVDGVTLPLVLTPGETFTFSAIFAPQSAARATGDITVISDASNATLGVSLAGTGTAQGKLTVAPTALNFGNAMVGSSVNKTSSISAGSADVTVTSASLNSSEFALSGISFPVTIPAGQSVPITLTFTPQSSGSVTAVLAFTSDASDNANQSLNGVGQVAAQHSVSLSWNDSGSGVAGYKVYRGNTSGGPYTQINSSLDTAASYSDSSVTSGQTYYYVTTAVDASGLESTYSNEAQAVIPTP